MRCALSQNSAGIMTVKESFCNSSDAGNAREVCIRVCLKSSRRCHFRNAVKFIKVYSYRLAMLPEDAHCLQFNTILNLFIQLLKKINIILKQLI